MPPRRAAGLGALALVLAATVPALAISDRRDQPTAADIPDGARQGDPAVAPPQAIKPSTKVMPGDTGLTGSTGGRTNPLDHLPPADRSSTGGGDGARDRR
ncbi:hypothetical protein [uncultured Methylobacterium sp.]|jgi:hypothetical protein|uniref:hypothetical protein n=1 Tax=uncultured Methylobacterium sp. TaxID=157278 RepID=UPI0026274BF8|nr:hypothetical protein [uncultured Methylobacterium sp.]